MTCSWMCGSSTGFSRASAVDPRCSFALKKGTISNSCGAPGSDFNGRIYADYLVEMTIDGRCVWEWRCWEHLIPEKCAIANLEDTRAEWTHGNSVVETPNGDLLLSFCKT